MRTKDSYLHKLMKGMDNRIKLVDEMKKYSIFAAGEMEIHSDLCGRNIIQDCLDFKQPTAMFEKANYFMKIIFDQPHSFNNYSILMGLSD